jgi:aspartate carbamoyltransferase regulatory subunit
VDCPNASCVTNHEPTESAFVVIQKDPVTLRCAYCDRDVVNVAEHVV